MKTVLMAALGVVGMAVAADAQLVVRYNKETSNSKLTITYVGGSYYGYGYGYGGSYGYSGSYGFAGGYGGGYGGSYGYGYGGGYWPGSYRTAVAPGVAAGMWHPGGAGYGVGYEGGGASYYSGPVRPLAGYGDAPVERVPERSPENVSSVAVDVGRQRLRSGDYRGAVEGMRAAVVVEGENPTSEAWFAVALALAGDARNADKALKAALGHGFKGKLDLALRDEKERGRALAACSKASGPAAAWVAALLGKPEDLQRLAEKDPSLKPLLP